jgi:hypothetical protein
MTATSKLPNSNVSLIEDPDLNAAVTRMLAPLSGKALERAQAAVRQVHGSGIFGTYTELTTAYRAAIAKAVGTDKET